MKDGGEGEGGLDVDDSLGVFWDLITWLASERAGVLQDLGFDEVECSIACF